MAIGLPTRRSSSRSAPLVQFSQYQDTTQMENDHRCVWNAGIRYDLCKK